MRGGGGPAKEDTYAIIQSGKESVKIEGILEDILHRTLLSLKSSYSKDFMACQNAHHAIYLIEQPP